MKKCKYHCDYGDGEYCHYEGESGCVMKIEIEISEEDYKRIESTVMTIEEMYETLDGRLYRAVVNGYRKCIKE